MSIELTSIDQLTEDEVQERQQILLSYLQEKHPELDLSRGALNDILLYLHAVLSARTSKDISRYKAAQSLLSIEQDPSLAEDDIVDKVLSNFNVSRKPASRARGQLMLELEDDLNFLIPVHTEFTFNGDIFVNSESHVVCTSDTTDGDVLQPLSNGRYGFILDVQAQEPGDTTTIAQGTEFDTELPDVVKCYAYADFIVGSEEEQNASLIARLASGMATPTWGNRYQIASLVRSNVESLTDISIVGFGDTEMTRDQTTMFPVSVGGKADIYVKTQVESRVVPVNASYIGTHGLNEVWQCNITPSMFPGCYRATSASIDGSVYSIAEQTVIDGVEGTSEQSLLIAIETDDLVAGVRTIGTLQQFDITLIGQSDIKTINDLFKDRSLMPLTEDARVLTARPAWVDVTLTLNKKGDNTADIAKAVTAYINSLGFDSKLPISEILKVVHPILTASQTVLEIGLSAEVWGADNHIYRCASSQTLEVPDDPLNGISNKTTVFYARDVVIK